MRRRRFSDHFDEVLAAAGDGRSWAFEHLFELVAKPLVGYFRAQAAWDPDGLTNETLVQAFTQIDRFQGDESDFRAWVFSIARCRLIDERRARARRVAPEPLDAAVGYLVPGGDAEEDALIGLGADWVEETLHSLVADQRDVLVLRIVADLTVDEIAATLGKTRGAVKALQRRGLAAVRRGLEAEPRIGALPVPM